MINNHKNKYTFIKISTELELSQTTCNGLQQLTTYIITELFKYTYLIWLKFYH